MVSDDQVVGSSTAAKPLKLVAGVIDTRPSVISPVFAGVVVLLDSPARFVSRAA
jgi:hypothetical protein